MPLRSAARYDHASERKASDTLPADLLARIKRKEIGRLGDYEVWAVDGRLIRDEVDTDWVEGGNPSRYGYQPEHELWVEGPVPEHGANALHEFLEARDMASGTDYETAHDKATKAERAFRSEHPTGDLVDAREFLDRWIDEDLAAPKPKRKPRARKFTKRQIEQRRAAGRARWAGVSKEEHAAVSRKGLAAAAGCAVGGPIGCPPPGYRGAVCGELITPSGKERACYSVRPLSSLITSHNPATWQIDPRYPAMVQERDYSGDRNEQAKVGRIAKAPDPRILLADSPTSVDGPPIITGSGVVLGGNGRTMGLRLAYELGTTGPYEAALSEKAPVFGLTAEQIAEVEQPVLVRVVQGLDSASQPELADASSRFNEGLTGSLDERARGVADSRRLSPETLAVIGKSIEENETLRKAMAEDGRAFVARLRTDGIVTAQNSAVMVDGAGGLTEAGKQRVEGAFLGLVAGTPERLAQASAATLAKLERIVPYLAQVRAANPAADAIHDFQQALDLLHSADAAKMTIDGFLAQGGLFGSRSASTHSSGAVEAARLLQLPPVKLATAAKRWAKSAAHDPAQKTLFGSPDTPTQSWAIFLKEGGVATASPKPTGSITYRHTSKPSENEDEPGMTYDVVAIDPSGNQIGSAYFGEYDGALRSGETEVDPAWQRKGIATGMYDYLEKFTGRTVEPSPVLSEDAKAFWDARRARKGEKAPKMAGIPRTSHAGDFASKTLAVASGIGPEGRWGSDRVYLASLYETLPEPRPDRAIWEQGLLGAARSGALRLAGGEYVGDMDASLYALSEVHDGPRIVRFLVTPPRSVAAAPSVE